MGDAIDFHEANFISLPDSSQSNVYGLVHLNIGDQNKLVVATVRAQIFCFEYQKDSVRPLLSPINFTYIPGTLRQRLKQSQYLFVFHLQLMLK